MRRGSVYASLTGIRSQGATEYLLILAVVLIVVGVAVAFLLATRPPAISITGMATKSDDNINFTPSTAMTPSSIPAADWKYAVYSDATKVYPTAIDWADAPGDLKAGIPIALVATGNQVGDVLKIRYKDSIFNTLIS